MKAQKIPMSLLLPLMAVLLLPPRARACGHAVAAPAPDSVVRREVFTTMRGAVPYRIPAIAAARNGDLIAVADYRYSGGDIGTGKIDLRFSRSRDNGTTWSAPATLVAGADFTDTTTYMHTGFGDPCIVADRRSKRVMLMCCSGAVMFPSGTRRRHQAIARFYSDDNGATWSRPTDISGEIYALFDSSRIGAPRSMFVGSGRIFQSPTVRTGKYFRLYCSVLYKDVSGVNKNYVLYSDDFGGAWRVLGGIDTAPIPQGADEPKVEELPDGSILCSSRCTGGRLYNIFRFTDSRRAQGSWGAAAFSGASNGGVAAEANSCNGEVMVVPARRRVDGAKTFLLLQSVPLGPGRANVGIYYKELASRASFANAAALAANWDGVYRVSPTGSAYSTMTLQADKAIGFLYEESTHGADYTIVYERLPLEVITGGKYEYSAVRRK